MDKQELIQNVRAALAGIIEPKLKWSIETLNLIKKIEISQNQGHCHLQINLVTEDEQEIGRFREDVFQALVGFKFAEIDLKIDRVNVAKQGLDGVKNIILVGSGKGGVGKSTIAVNLASMLKLKGYSVGLMDADIYGPSVPILMKKKEKPEVLADEVLMPVDSNEIRTISIGNLVPPEKAISWRGQLVSGTILQFIRKTNWGMLDYLIVDMPPGTGDVQLTIAHELKVKGIVVVSMPQQVVLGDVRRCLDQYREKRVPVLGVIQNMVMYECEKCGHVQTIFPESKDRLDGVEEIGSLPLNRDLCDAGNNGTPYILANQDTPVFKAFDQIVEKIEKNIAQLDVSQRNVVRN